jgi:long-chain acyl-CoA synthetase
MALAAHSAPPASRPELVITVDGYDTPTRLLRARAVAWAARPALRYKRKGIWHSVDWATYYANTRATGLALLGSGCRRGDVVAILAENRPEWLYADLGAQCAGLISSGIYPTSSTEQVEYVLRQSGARVLFVEDDEQLDKALAVRTRCPDLRLIVVMDWTGLRGFSDAGVVAMADFLEKAGSDDAAFDASIDLARQSDTAFLVYTSGTTGAPKGAMISNRSLMFQMTVVSQLTTIGALDRTLSFLPLCHIAERMATVYNQLAIGMIVHFPENSGTVINDMREVAPHMVFAPPRFWEKLYSQVELFMRDAIAPARWLYNHSVSKPSGLLPSLVLTNVRKSLGLQNVKSAITGAAPVPPELLKWYAAIGIELLEAYGMTEATGFCSVTPPGQVRIGYAGLKARGTEMKIGSEGEILLRGPHVFQGYWRMPDQTTQAIDGEGWLHTGDCGELDADGYLKINDRLKDIIITSGGKNITPKNIESALKFSPYIADAMVIGEGKRYLTCLVMIDYDNVAKYAQDAQVPYTDFVSLTRTAEVQALIRAEIETVNHTLARVEQIKDFRLIAELLTAEDEELTPTMKLKRRVVARKYASLIDAMYSNEN